MVELLPCLDDVAHSSQHKDWKSIIAASSYIVTLVFMGLLFFTIYNVWCFLYKQRKWRVWSLSFFYVLVTLQIILRIYITIYIVCATNKINTFGADVTAVLKVCIGIEQIMVILEIAIKVRESFKSMHLWQS